MLVSSLQVYLSGAAELVEVEMHDSKQVFVQVQGAQFQTGRCLYAGHAYLAQHKPREASAVFGRARERAAAAIERWRECEHPDAAALAELDAVDAQVEVGRLCLCTSHASGCSLCSV